MTTTNPRVLQLPVHLAVITLLTTLAVLWGVPSWAEPGDYDVELFSGTQRKVFSLADGENQRPCEGGYGWAALKTGKKVAVLIQRFHSVDRLYPAYCILTGTHESLPKDFTTVRGEMSLFRLGKPVGVWPVGHPDGVTFSKYRSTTIVGGVNPEAPALFCRLYKPHDPWFVNRIQGIPLPWVTVYGQTTYLKIFDGAQREILHLTSKGKDVADYDLSGLPALKNMARFEVGIRKIELVPGPGPVTGPATPDTRRYWVVTPGRYFLNTGGKTWDEFGGGRKVFTFTETRRTAEFVEFFDTSRNLWIRLYADRAVVMRKDDPSLKWEALFPGKWSLEQPPEMSVGPGPPPATPMGPPGSGLLPPVLPSGSPNLTGAWTSNIGIVYQVQQSGPNFTWTAAMLKESGQGQFLSKNEIAAQWSGPGGSGSAKGKITQTDSTGKPTRIEWSHGIVFTRK